MTDTCAPDFNYSELEERISSTSNTKARYNAIVNAPFEHKLAATMLDLGVIVLLVHNKKDKTIDRIALSETDSAKSATMASVIPFDKIQIPITSRSNTIVQAIESNTAQSTEDWSTLFIPALSAQLARNNQKAAGIDCSYVVPWKGNKKSGALIFSYYQPKRMIKDNHILFMNTYAAIVGKTF